jgi:general secretion pathway protein G
MTERLSERVRSVSLLELVVVVILIAIFIRIAIDRIWPLRIVAEKTAVVEVRGAIESALGITVAGRIARGEPLAAIARLAGTNPVHLLATPPDNYLGSFAHPGRHRIPRGSWYFNRSTRTLVYVVRFASHFKTPLPGRKRIRFRVEAVYRNRRQVPDDLAGIRLVTLNPYVWKVPR